MAANPREELIAYLAKMSDKEVGKLLQFAQILHDENAQQENENDPFVDIFDGDPRLSERVEDILWEEFGRREQEDTSAAT